LLITDTPGLEPAEIRHAARIRQKALVGIELILFDLAEVAVLRELFALPERIFGLLGQARNEVRQPRPINDGHTLGESRQGQRHAKAETENGARETHQRSVRAAGLMGVHRADNHG